MLLHDAGGACQCAALGPRGSGKGRGGYLDRSSFRRRENCPPRALGVTANNGACPKLVPNFPREASAFVETVILNLFRTNCPALRQAFPSPPAPALGGQSCSQIKRGGASGGDAPPAGRSDLGRRRVGGKTPPEVCRLWRPDTLERPKAYTGAPSGAGDRLRRTTGPAGIRMRSVRAPSKVHRCARPHY